MKFYSIYLVFLYITLVVAGFTKSYDSNLQQALKGHNNSETLAIEKRSLVSDNDPKIIKQFDSVKQMVSSAYFKNENRHKNVVAQIAGSENYFEIKPTGKQEELGIFVLETQLGEAKQAALLDQPISGCAFAESQKISASFSRSSSFSQKFAHKTSININGQYRNEIVGLILAAVAFAGYAPPSQLVNLTISIGGTANFEIERANGHSFGGSVSCDSGPGGIVQLFTSLRYIYYPEAKSRVLLFNEATGEVQSTGPWESAFSSDQYPQYGLVFYDNSNGAEYACVNDKQYLQCSSEIDLKVFVPDFDPATGLHMALTR